MEKREVSVVVESFMSEIKDSLAGGDNVYLRGFGSFVIKQRAEKLARNISKNTTIIVPQRSVPVFKASKEFKDIVKNTSKK
ncbi:DNA-binding protein HU [Ichthyobacterium seriolicida]|uniref:DNA-binding protein HU n=2 Tax=Ichthyobacterium seriolicida TaxID=242600 RepID=A0A1J1ECH2_9FLAO|nr:DNA-binding protein HU [Ichthyobacterium seriolicida]